MTYRKQVIGVVILLLVILVRTKVYAEEINKLPVGEILVIYSDGAGEKTLKQVRAIVEVLTYQGFQVTFASASECRGQIENYNNIICFKLEHYPLEIISELYKQELKGQEILAAAGEEVVLDGIQIMFVGNDFFRNYLSRTGRTRSFADYNKTVGKITYYFNDYTAKAVLAKENDYLLLKGEMDYQSGLLEIENDQGYFCATQGVLTHIPVSDMNDNLIRAAFTREVALWKWPYNGEPHIYAQYIVLDQVYPFQDPNKLMEVVNLLIEKEEPFVISVMPNYRNNNYPAMQHFCEVLRYAQANGGVIMMHSPINQMGQIDVDLVNEYISTALRNYMKHGVYPMGIEVPRNWMFHADTVEIMSRFSTVLVSEEEDSFIKADQRMYSNIVYKDGHRFIAPTIPLDSNGISYTRVHSSAVIFDIMEDMEKIEERLNACRSSYVPTKSLWDIEHSLWTDEDILTYQNGIILVNNKRVDKKFTKTEYEEEFEYKRNMIQRFSTDLAAENRKLLIAVIGVSVLFILFILLARGNNKKRFFYRDTRDDYAADYPEDYSDDSQ